MTTVDDLPDSAVAPAISVLRLLRMFNGVYVIDPREPDWLAKAAKDVARCGLADVDETYSPEQGRMVTTIRLRNRRTPHGKR